MRTGLVGASAAMAMGAVAVSSGLLPGPGELGGQESGDRIRADGASGLDGQGLPSGSVSPSSPSSASASPDERNAPEASRGDARTEGPTASPSHASGSGDPSSPSASPADSASGSEERDGSAAGTGSPPQRQSDGSRSSDGDTQSGADAGHGTGTGASPGASAPTSGSAEAAAEAEVLKLVNQERAQAGCKPVTADGELAELAGDFSEDMAERGFFSHTSPDGKSPWDRAEARGIADLGGENIAKGQTDAEAVMESWMNSPGHRANILNCDYRTLGVGAHLAEGGPWWTQDFGF